MNVNRNVVTISSRSIMSSSSSSSVEVIDKHNNNRRIVRHKYDEQDKIEGTTTTPKQQEHSSVMGIRQLFDHESSTYTYILWDKETLDGIIVDPVDTKVDRDVEVINDLGLRIWYGLNTHVHADHITGTGLLKRRLMSSQEGDMNAGYFQSVISTSSGAKADIHVNDGDEIVFGNRSVIVVATPGHTIGCCSYVSDDKRFVLTGDTLLINGCGRTDFQGGSSSTLYESIKTKLFVPSFLPESCIVYPAHDYKSRTSSTIGNEMMNNPRLGGNITQDEFITIMENLKLSYPKKMDISVPANMMRCGVPDDDDDDSDGI